MSGHILHLTISHSHVFLLNSRLGHFSATLLRGHPFSRSYRVILPSSLAVIHSSTLGFSPRLPVSVYGTGTYMVLLRSFSWKSDYHNYLRSRSLAVLSGFIISHGFAYEKYNYALQRTIPSVRVCFTTPSLHRPYRQYGNINPSTID